MEQVGLEPRRVGAVVEARVGVELPRGVLGELGDCGNVDVLVRENEHLDAKLAAAEFDGGVLVPCV